MLATLLLVTSGLDRTADAVRDAFTRALRRWSAVTRSARRKVGLFVLASMRLVGAFAAPSLSAPVEARRFLLATYRLVRTSHRRPHRLSVRFDGGPAQYAS